MFINQDSYLGEGNNPPSLHRYLYAYSNPTIYLDRDGNFPVTEQVAAWLNQRAADNTDALKSVQAEHGSTMATRSVAAISGVGAAIFSVAGGIVGLADMGLDANAANLRHIPGADKISVIKEAAEKTDQRREAISNAVTSVKDYVSQEKLAEAVKRDAGKAADAASTYAGDVFVRGNLDATASFSGAMAEMAAGGVLARSAKASKITPKVTGETPNVHERPSNSPEPRNSAADGCPCCFAGGTPVLTKDGLKPIELVKEGELVASRDEKTGEIEWKPVTKLFVNKEDRITYALILVDAQGHEEKYEVTDNHPFNVDGLGWVDSINLKAGMKIPSYEGGYLTVVGISALNRKPVTYNFEVKDFHTYFVGEQGAWVHNQCSCYTTVNADSKGPVYQVKIKEKVDTSLIPDSPNQKISASDFEKSISRLPANERVARVKEFAKQVAEQNGLQKNKRLSKINKRDVYEGENGEFYSLDTQHGRFEKVNSSGEHLGEVNFDFESVGKLDKSGGHDLIVK